MRHRFTLVSWREAFKPSLKFSLFVILVPYLLIFWSLPFYFFVFSSMNVDEYAGLVFSPLWESFTTLIYSVAPAVTIASGLLLGVDKAVRLYLMSYLPITVFEVLLVAGSLLEFLPSVVPLGSMAGSEALMAVQLTFLAYALVRLVAAPVAYIWLVDKLLRRRLHLFLSILVPTVLMVFIYRGTALNLDLFTVESIAFTFALSLALRRVFMKAASKK